MSERYVPIPKEAALNTPTFQPIENNRWASIDMAHGHIVDMYSPDLVRMRAENRQRVEAGKGQHYPPQFEHVKRGR